MTQGDVDQPTAPLSRFTLAQDAMAPVHAFDDIPVVPALSETGMIVTGGPIWPDWQAAHRLRHNRNFRAVDSRPPDPADLRDFDEAAIWGGHVVPHFGHWLAEHGTRVLAATRARPQDRMLFTVAPNAGSDAAGEPQQFFWQCLKWLGVDADRVHLVRRALRVRRLHAVAMAEQWDGVMPSGGYLDLLDQNAARQGLDIAPDQIVYVARDGMIGRGEGGNAGEAYVVRCLKALGVRVIRPEALALEDQLRHYASARLLIFAEGSALHGWQLLGRIDQHVVVLNRRAQMRIGHAALMPRTTRLTYVEATRAIIAVQWPTGKFWMVRAISLYDLPALFEAFAHLGLSLGKVWDQPAFEKARDADMANWIALRLSPGQPIARNASIGHVRGGLARHGLSHLIPLVPEPQT